MKNIFDFLKFKKEQSSEFLIDDELVKKHSKNVFNSLLSFYSEMEKITLSQDTPNASNKYKELIRLIEDEIGINPASKYGESLLKNDDFKMMVIYNLGIANIIGRQPSFAEYNFFKQILESLIESIQKESLSKESSLIKGFKVNPKILPIKIIQYITAIDEYTMATSFIVKRILNLNDFKNYDSYNNYYDYVNHEVKKITNDLHEKGFYNTHNEDRFTALCISYACKLPMLDTLYKKPTNERITGSDIEIPVKVIKNLHRTVFQLMGKEAGDESEEIDND